MTNKESASESLRGRQLSGALPLIATVIRACEDTKALNPVVLDVSKIFSLSDFFVIVSGKSDRQVQGITNKIVSNLQEKGVKPLSVEGEDKAHWVLIDLGDVIIHVFYEPEREHYDLESLWHNARKLDLSKEIGPLELPRQAA
ncbi:MAG: ribosome silencing factor [Deltaproteobacteria bacterium]|nr:ribosome silencing factor [Deltaproteobacteria bacterium]